jgi:hypothetical protein
MKASAIIPYAGCGLSAANAAAPSQNIRAALATEGLGPTSHTKAATSRQDTALALKGPKSGPRRAAASMASMERCWPDKARMCAQPESLNAWPSSASKSSRTPTMSASSSGPALPPARLKDSRSDCRRPKRKSSRAGALRASPTSPAPAKSGARPSDPRAGAKPSSAAEMFPVLMRSAEPRGRALPPRAYTCSSPRHDTRAPSSAYT